MLNSEFLMECTLIYCLIMNFNGVVYDSGESLLIFEFSEKRTTLVCPVYEHEL